MTMEEMKSVRRAEGNIMNGNAKAKGKRRKSAGVTEPPLRVSVAAWAPPVAAPKPARGGRRVTRDWSTDPV